MSSRMHMQEVHFLQMSLPTDHFLRGFLKNVNNLKQHRTAVKRTGS